MLVEAPGEKLVPGVDGCLLRLVHQDVFFLQAQAAGVVACLEGGAVGEDPPLDVDVIMEDALVLEGPDVAGQLGVFPLLGVLEVGLVVPIPRLPVGRTDPDVLHGGLGGGGHLRLVHHLPVHAPGPLHHADGVPPPTVAVLLPQVGGGGGDLGVVAGHNLAKIGHGPVGQLHCVSVQDFVKGVASREAAVEQLEKLPANVALDTLAEGWIEPQDVAATSPPPSSWAAGWAVDELMVIASPLEGVLERNLGGLEHGLVHCHLMAVVLLH